MLRYKITYWYSRFDQYMNRILIVWCIVSQFMHVAYNCHSGLGHQQCAECHVSDFAWSQGWHAGLSDEGTLPCAWLVSPLWDPRVTLETWLLRRDNWERLGYTKVQPTMVWGDPLRLTGQSPCHNVRSRLQHSFKEIYLWGKSHNLDIVPIFWKCTVLKWTRHTLLSVESTE